MHCPSCGFENPEGMNFCGECGTPLTGRCPSQPRPLSSALIRRSPRLRYVAPRPYPAEAFEHPHRWRRSWDLIPEGATYDQLVEHRVGAAGWMGGPVGTTPGTVGLWADDGPLVEGEG